MQPKTFKTAPEKCTLYRIPPVVRLSIVPIQLESVIVKVQVEHVRVAVAVGICIQCHLCHHQFSLLNAKEIWLNIIWDLKSTNTIYQVDSFLKENTHPPQKALTVCALNMCQLERFQKAVAV